MGNVKCLVTNKGRELLNKCQAEGVAMEFTALKSGSGIYDKFDDLKDRTELKEYKQTFDDFYVSREGEETIIRSTLSNETVNENYKVREIGIWAKEKGTDNEILYAISVTLDDEMADLMFTKKGNYSTALEYNHYFKISESVNVYINADSGGLLQRMYEKFQQIEESLSDEIRKFANYVREFHYYIDERVSQHINSLVTDENGVHGLRYYNDELQVKTGDDWTQAGGATKTGTVIPPANMVKFQAVARNGFIDLYFKEPANTVYQGSVLADVKGVMIRRSQVDYPKTPKDGDLVIDNTDLGMYETSPYADRNVINDVPNFYTAFPYTNYGVFNTYWEQNKLTITANRGQILNITSNEDCTIKIYENSVYKTDLTLSANQLTVYTFDANTSCKLVPQLKSPKYITPKEQLITIKAIEDPKDITFDYVYVGSFSSCSPQALAKTIKYHQDLSSVFKIGDVKQIPTTIGACQFQIIRITPTEIKMRLLNNNNIITHISCGLHSIFPGKHEGGLNNYDDIDKTFRQAFDNEKISTSFKYGYDIGSLADIPANRVVTSYTGSTVGFYIGYKNMKNWADSYTTQASNGTLICTKPNGEKVELFYGDHRNSSGGCYYRDYPEIYNKLTHQISLTLRR